MHVINPAVRPEERVPTIVIADDSPMDRLLAGRVLTTRLNARVLFAEDGAQALECVARELPDLVLTDLQMPHMDGLTLVRELRKGYPLIPSVLMTAHGSEEIALQALQQGAANYVPKRTLAFRLPEVVQDVLSVSRTNRQLLRLRECWLETTLAFCLDNDATLIPPLVQHLQSSRTALFRCDETEVVRIGVALHEAVRNGMHHGNLELDSRLRDEDGDAYYQLAETRRFLAPYRDRRVHISVFESATESRYVIRDEGDGFDYQSFIEDDPTALGLLERRSGRGLFLIRTFMDEVLFNDRGNEITLIHRRT